MSKEFFVTLLGLFLLVICSVPTTSVEEVIDASFTISPGAKYGPNDPGTRYHTRIHFILGKSILKGEVVVEGEGIYLTADFYNTEHPKGLYTAKQYSFTIDPADDLYVFTFDNIEGQTESLVRFRLEEIWTRPVAIGSPLGFIVGLVGFLSFSAGLAALALNRVRTKDGLTVETAYGWFNNK